MGCPQAAIWTTQVLVATNNVAHLKVDNTVTPAPPCNPPPFAIPPPPPNGGGPSLGPKSIEKFSLDYTGFSLDYTGTRVGGDRHLAQKAQETLGAEENFSLDYTSFS